MARALSRAFYLLSATVALPPLAGCPNAGSAPPLPEHRSFTPAPVMPAQTAAPTTPASSLAPLPTDVPPSQAPDEVPSPVPSVFTGPTTSLQGKIYDEKGATVDAASVTVRSLSATAPYTTTTAVVQGNYSLRDVPEGVQLEVSVSRSGWTTRSRVTVLQAVTGARNELNFGAPSSDPRGEDAPHFISDYPEIVSALPTPETQKAQTLSYSVRFSEPFSQEARDRVESAFQIDSLPPPVALQPADLTPVQRAERVVLVRGSSFLDSSVRLKMEWNEAQDQLRVTFPVPLRQSKDETVGYRLQLLRRSGDGLIADAGGRTLGLLNPDEGQAYFAVRKGALTLAPTDTTAELRWQATHQRTSTFAVEKDATAPVLQKVEVSETVQSSRGGANYYRFDLTFSKPMRVYPDERGYTESLTQLDNYVFALSTRTLDAVKMDSDVGTFSTDDTAANFVLGFADPRRPFTFVNPSDSDNTNDVFVRATGTDARVVSVFVPRAALPTNLSQVKVRVKKELLDPAGNGVSEANAKSDTNTADNIVSGRF